MKQLEYEIHLAKEACRSASEALLERFPVGSHVRFKISSTQKNWSTGIVEGAACGLGSLQVRHLIAKAGSRFSYRTVYFKNIEDWDQ
jgi:hypothetical protein